MKRKILVVLLLSLMLMLGGCKGKEKEFVMGDNELIHLTSTPKGGVETYQIYTTNIMIYVDGTVRIYANDFVRWLGVGEIPEVNFKISQEEIKVIEQIIISEDLYNLREDVGNKDGISGTVKYMTVYSAEGTNTTGGISVSNRQFVRAYDSIETIVREELYAYSGTISTLQYEGYLAFANRSVKLLDRENEEIFNHDDINDVYSHSEEDIDTGEVSYYTVIQLNDSGQEILGNITWGANEETPVILILQINDIYETSVALCQYVEDGKVFISQSTQEEAEQLSVKIKDNIR